MGPNEWDFSTAVMREAFRLGERFVLLLPALLTTVANKEQVATAVDIARIRSAARFDVLVSFYRNNRWNMFKGTLRMRENNIQSVKLTF